MEVHDARASAHQLGDGGFSRRRNLKGYNTFYCKVYRGIGSFHSMLDLIECLASTIVSLPGACKSTQLCAARALAWHLS